MAKKKAARKSTAKPKASKSKAAKPSTSDLSKKGQQLASQSLKAGKAVMAAVREEGMRLVNKLVKKAKPKQAKRKK